MAKEVELNDLLLRKTIELIMFIILFLLFHMIFIATQGKEQAYTRGIILSVGIITWVVSQLFSVLFLSRVKLLA